MLLGSGRSTLCNNKPFVKNKLFYKLDMFSIPLARTDDAVRQVGADITDGADFVMAEYNYGLSGIMSPGKG